MTQKEIWSGYCARFVEIIAPLHIIKWIGSMFVKKPTPVLTRKGPPPLKLPHRQVSQHQEEISKILDTMLKEARNER